MDSCRLFLFNFNSTKYLISLFFFLCVYRAVWGYECQNSRCAKIELNESENTKAVSLPVCRIFCGNDPGTLWPKPNGFAQLKTVMARITPNDVQFNLLNNSKRNEDFWKANEAIFLKRIKLKVPKSVQLNDDGNRLMLMINVENQDGKLNHQTNEHYNIQAYENTGVVLVKIKAETIFGARHALETLSQLIIFDNIRNELQVVGEFEIDDKPAFSHRGFLLDTARNYFSVAAIKRTIGKLLTFFRLLNCIHHFVFKSNFRWLVNGEIEHISLAHNRFAKFSTGFKITSGLISIGCLFSGKGLHCQRYCRSNYTFLNMNGSLSQSPYKL